MQREGEIFTAVARVAAPQPSPLPHLRARTRTCMGTRSCTTHCGACRARTTSTLSHAGGSLKSARMRFCAPFETKHTTPEAWYMASMNSRWKSRPCKVGGWCKVGWSVCCLAMVGWWLCPCKGGAVTNVAVHAGPYRLQASLVPEYLHPFLRLTQRVARHGVKGLGHQLAVIAPAVREHAVIGPPGAVAQAACTCVLW